MSVWIGKTLGKVRIEKLLGRGGMAEVYLGTHTTLQRPVAVKFLHGYFEENTDLFERFQREARVAAGLRHPNIIQVYDYDVVDDRPYIVMEYINGPSLAAYLKSIHERSGQMPLGMIRRILPMLATALDYAHQQHVAHRADVVLVSVRDDNAAHPVGFVEQVVEVGDDVVNAEHVVLREHDARVYNQNIAAVFTGGHILADLSQPSPRGTIFNFSFLLICSFTSNFNRILSAMGG